MTLRDTISEDATGVFLDVDAFAESVTYTPRGGSTRSILAIVEREDQESDDAGAVVPVFFVRVANDSTYGISSDEINLGGDTVTLPPRDGKTSEIRAVVRIIEQDHGMLTVRCQ